MPPSTHHHSNPASVSLFHKARDTNIINSTFNVYNEVPVTGAAMLAPHIAKGARHNSGHPFDTPPCHPNTREAIQQNILGWADELVAQDMKNIVTWLRGLAGAGKSAIARSIADELAIRGQLTASFFFSRANDGTGRDTEAKFVTTISYQICTNIASTDPLIAATVRTDPRLVDDASLEQQIKKLIVDPLNAVANDHSSVEKPRVIVVDGLDECRTKTDAQRRVVDALISGLRQIMHRNHKLFITSRLEDHIASIFLPYGEHLIRTIDLDNQWHPDDDIRTFLFHGFANIRRLHFYFRDNLPVDNWPTKTAIKKIVRKASGNFIYASTVLKYIGSPEDNYDPTERLKVILQLTNNADEPYADLDALYRYIFSQVKDIETVLAILSIRQPNYGKNSENRGPLEISQVVPDLLRIPSTKVRYLLRPLRSVLEWKDGRVKYTHASLKDFLYNHDRSKEFFINSEAVAMRIVRQSHVVFKDMKEFKDSALISVTLLIPVHYAKMLPEDYSQPLAHDIEALKRLLSCASERTILDVRVPVREYLHWLFSISGIEDQKRSTSRLMLHKAALDTSAWLTGQLTKLVIPFSDRSTGHANVLPFVVFSLLRLGPFKGKAVIRQGVGQVISAVEEIYSASPNLSQVQQGTYLSTSHESVLLCSLLTEIANDPIIMPWLQPDDPLTPEEYKEALLRTSSYIWPMLLNGSLPTDPDDSTPNRCNTYATHVALRIYPTLLRKAAHHPDVFFMLLHAVRPKLGLFRERIKAIRETRSMKEPYAQPMIRFTDIYQAEARNHIPELKDPHSPEYHKMRVTALFNLMSYNIFIPI